MRAFTRPDVTELSGGDLVLRGRSATLTVPLLKATSARSYPPVTGLFPDRAAATATATVVSDELLRAVRQVAAVCSRNLPLLVERAIGSADLGVRSAHDRVDASASTRLPVVEFTGEPLSVALTPEYLRKSVSALRSEQVTVHVTAAMKPLLVTAADRPGLAVLLMPVRSVD